MSLTLESISEWIVMPMLSLAVLLTLVALIRGPRLSDRVVALDLLTTLAIAVAAVTALATREAVLLDVAIVIALLGFLGTVGFTHYMERSS